MFARVPPIKPRIVQLRYRWSERPCFCKSAALTAFSQPPSSLNQYRSLLPYRSHRFNQISETWGVVQPLERELAGLRWVTAIRHLDMLSQTVGSAENGMSLPRPHMEAVIALRGCSCMYCILLERLGYFQTACLFEALLDVEKLVCAKNHI